MKIIGKNLIYCLFKNGVISIYDFSSFAEELSELSLDGLLSSFSALLSESNQLSETQEFFDL